MVTYLLSELCALAALVLIKAENRMRVLNAVCDVGVEDDERTVLSSRNFN
jgi:hypothetical protein